MDFPLHFVSQLLILPICAPESASSYRIKHKNNETAVLGGNVTIFCNLTTPADVVQITWQKIQDSLPQNIGTYSSKYGEKILPPYIDRLHCKIIEPNSSFITIHEVTFEDEACYKCLFNVFPHGSHGGQICLNILTVSELTSEPRFHLDSTDLLSFNYSVVGKPAPRISLFPSQVLNHSPEEYLTQNPNGTVTVSKVYTISLETVRFLGLLHLILHMDHPLWNEEKIVPLPVKPECPISTGVYAVLIIMGVLLSLLLLVLIIIIILYIAQRKKNSESRCEPSSSQLRELHMETLLTHPHPTQGT